MDRRCERCGGSIPRRLARERSPDGLLVCPHCHQAGVQPAWAARTAGYQMTPDEARRHLADEHGWSAEEMDSAHPDDLRGLHVGLHEVGKMFAWAPHSGHEHTSGLLTVAHESDDDMAPAHCAWCGSGQTVATSDGSINCGYCDRTYTVRLQPKFPAMPQTVDGQPYPPGQPGADPGAPGDEVPGQLPAGEVDPSQPPDQEQDGAPPDDQDDDGDVPAFLRGKGSTLRTSTGGELSVAQYLRHLALVESGYAEPVLEQVRADAAS